MNRPGAFADRLRVQWTWARPLPDGLDPATTGPLLCGGITVFSPLLQHSLPFTASVGIVGIGGLGHMALQVANRWGCEVHAFTTSDSKEAEARKLGAHYVHKPQRDVELKKIAGSLDLILSTINVPLDIPGLLEPLRRKAFCTSWVRCSSRCRFPPSASYWANGRFSVRPSAVRQPSTECSSSVRDIPLRPLPKLS